MDIFEELKGYKELLDSGIISQEEFDNKKRELLSSKEPHKENSPKETSLEIESHEGKHIAKDEREAEESRIATEKATKKRNKIIAIVTPIVVVCVAFIIILIKFITPSVKYNAAVALYNAGKYDEAITAFTALNGYKDSVEQIEMCRYGAAVALCNAGKYDEAITAFTALNGYKDSVEQIEMCKYEAAVALYNEGKFDEAITAFTALNGYKDSEAQIEKCYIGIFGDFYYLVQNVEVGDVIKFGSYEQDDDTSNGREEIEWIVLEKDDASILLISKYGLDCQPFCTSLTDVTWETCSLRTWLNGTFLNTAFSSEERNIIISSTVTAEGNPKHNISGGNNTTDKVFVLSQTELEKYSSISGVGHFQNTAYCLAQGSLKTAQWLRTPGRLSNRTIFIYEGWEEDTTGHYYGAEVNVTHIAVRPVLQIGF